VVVNLVPIDLRVVKRGRGMLKKGAFGKKKKGREIRFPNLSMRKKRGKKRAREKIFPWLPKMRGGKKGKENGNLSNKFSDRREGGGTEGKLAKSRTGGRGKEKEVRPILHPILPPSKKGGGGKESKRMHFVPTTGRRGKKGNFPSISSVPREREEKSGGTTKADIPVG